LATLAKLTAVLPAYSFVYLGDTAHNPYGDKTPEEIYALTAQGVRTLFAAGAELVILACNTASAAALCQIQQELLPAEFPGKKVLGILVPAAEAVAAGDRIGVLATAATVRTGAYSREIKKTNPRAEVFEEACPGLVQLIENGRSGSAEFENLARGYLDSLMKTSGGTDSLILGCTHYELVGAQFAKHLPAAARIFQPSAIAAVKLTDYLQRHPEVNAKLARKGEMRVWTTGDPEEFRRVGRALNCALAEKVMIPG